MIPIKGFMGEYRFLSNFWPSVIVHEGVTYPTVEHAYQAAKCRDQVDRDKIIAMPTPGLAKSYGKHVSLIDEWYEVRLDVMYRLNVKKYTSHRDLRQALIATEDRVIEEANTWRDTFWGTYKGKGYNHLGRILMRIRSELSNATPL